VDLDDLQRAAREMQQVRRPQQRVSVGVPIDIVLELATRVVERARELAIDQIERMSR